MCRLSAGGAGRELASVCGVRDSAISLLKQLTEAHAVPGHEGEVRQIFVKQLQDVGQLSSDRNGSVFCEFGDGGPRVLIAGHMDEVGFMVQNITHDGFLQIVALGGWWEHNLLSQRVEVLTRSGEKILGVIASKPPHFLPESQRRQVMSIDQLFIDIGASTRAQVIKDFGVSIGDPIAPWSPFTPFGKGDLLLAKAFDNRVGMAGAIQSGQLLRATSLSNTIILAGTVQEEVGLRGAKTAAVHTKPDVAIVLEGPPADDTPGFPLHDAQGRIGGGVQIRVFDPTAIANPRLVELAVRTAIEENIPHQVTVRRSGGTDAGSFHLANEGIPSIVLGTPARYIHSHNAVIDVNDYLHMVSLATAMARRLDAETVAGLTKFI